jgi:hypothetical protein
VLELLFADDQVCIGESVEDVKKIAENLDALFSKYGFKINKDKTKFMLCFPREADKDTKVIEVGGEEIKRVTEFRYLGTWISDDGGDTYDIKDKINEATKRSGAIKKVMNNKKMPVKLRFKTLMTFVYPVVSQGCETWALNEGQCKALNIWWHKRLRACLGVNVLMRIKIKRILQIFGTEELSTYLRKRRAGYLGHIVRYPEQRHVRKLIFATIDGKRNKGRRSSWNRSTQKMLRDTNATLDDSKESALWSKVVEGERLPDKAPTGRRQSQRLRERREATLLRDMRN